MKTNKLKIFAIALIALPMIAISSLNTYTVRAFTAADDDIAAIYKAKCAMCHSPKAEKAYNPEMPMEEQITAILKGKKTEKPPAMPGFEAKGMTPEQAKALAEHMKTLRTPSN